jgi:hypothetical protein
VNKRSVSVVCACRRSSLADEGDAFLHDLVLDLEELLAPPALLPLEPLDLLLDLVLRLKGGCLAGLAAEGLDLFLGVLERLLGPEHLVAIADLGCVRGRPA